MDFYKLGATAALEKLAVGERQLRRIVGALAKTPLPRTAIPTHVRGQSDRQLLQLALQRLKGSPEARLQQLQEQLAARHRTGEPFARVMGVGRRGRKMQQNAPTESFYRRLQRRHAPEILERDAPGYTHEQLSGLYRGARQEGGSSQALLQDIRKELQSGTEVFTPRSGPSVRTTGRHRPEEVANLTLPAEDVRVIDTGRVPDVAWRGSKAPVKVKGDAPLWFSGIPEVSAGYAHGDLGGMLRAYDFSKVPKRLQGPFTPHTAADPFSLSPEPFRKAVDAASNPGTARRGLGRHSKYEKVIRADAARKMPVVSEYKVLPSDVRDYPAEFFMRPTQPAMPITAMLRRGEPLLKSTR